MAWPPNGFSIEFTFNGEYESAYELVKAIHLANNRVNLTAADNTMASPKKLD